jgi:hypothetical protein
MARPLLFRINVIDVGQFGGGTPGSRAGVLYESVRTWVDLLIRYQTDYRLATFIVWPVGDKPLDQLAAFARDVIPAVRAGVER